MRLVGNPYVLDQNVHRCLYHGFCTAAWCFWILLLCMVPLQHSSPRPGTAMDFVGFIWLHRSAMQPTCPAGWWRLYHWRSPCAGGGNRSAVRDPLWLGCHHHESLQLATAQQLSGFFWLATDHVIFTICHLEAWCISSTLYQSLASVEPIKGRAKKMEV